MSKDCAEDVLENWADVLQKWKTTHQRPKQLNSLVKLGIPEALRGEVWQRLAGSDEELLERYRLLITKVFSNKLATLFMLKKLPNSKLFNAHA